MSDTTVEQITKKMEDKEKEKSIGIAQGLIKSMGIKIPQVPVCFICGEQVMGGFVEYFDKHRTKRIVCMPCVFRALDFFLEKGMAT